MVRVLILLAFMFTSIGAFADCTITGTVTWVNTPTPTCANGGIITIAAGATLEFDSPSDIWTGTTIIVEGTLLITGNGSQINANILVKSGGLLTVTGKLRIGPNTAGCGYTLQVELGGIVNVTDGGSGADDRLYICNKTVIISDTPGGSCNTYVPNADPPTALPYCNPIGGFQCGGVGQPVCPLIFSEGGLPIELLFFKASKGLKKVSLSWATASELNFDYFDVEKSSDGTNFNSLARIKGNGTTNIRQDYSLEDEKPLVGKNYYRLKAVDFDGYTEYFNVVMVDFDGSKAFSVSPNPSDGVTFTTETNFKQENRAFVAIYSTIGSEIARFEVTGNKSSLALPVKLESGVYYAKYISSDFTSTVRVLVK
jgi:hypothetical protein